LVAIWSEFYGVGAEDLAGSTVHSIEEALMLNLSELFVRCVLDNKCNFAFLEYS